MRSGLGGQPGSERGGRTCWNVLGTRCRPIAGVGIDREVGRERQLLQADQAGALLRRYANAIGERRLVFLGIGVPPLLDEPDTKRFALGPIHARRGFRRLQRGDERGRLHARESMSLPAPAG